MKPYSILLSATLIAGFAVAQAQEVVPVVPAATAPSVENGTPQPSLSTPDLFPSVPQTDTSVPTTTSPVVPSEPLAVQPAPLKKGTAEQLRQAIQIRELKTKVLEDPQVVTHRAAAECAKTEEGRRISMRNYYTLLYTKIGQLDPSLTPLLNAQLHDILVRYEQHNVRPSILIECVSPLPGSASTDHAGLPGKPAPAPEAPSKKKTKS